MAMLSGFPLTLSAATSFAGSSTSIDGDFDYSDDAVYFGLTGYTGGADTGSLQRLTINTNAALSTVSSVLSSTQPITAQPYTLTDALGAHWVYVGTGRFITNSDNAGTNQQYYYGIKDSFIGSASISNMVDTTNIQVFGDGSILDPTNAPTSSVEIGGNTVTSIDALKIVMQSKDGWYRKLDFDGTNPSARVGNVANSIGTTLLFVDYQPGTDPCAPEGSSALFALDFQAGVAPKHGALGYDGSTTNNSTSLALSSVSLGKGLSSEPITHSNEDGDVQVITQSSTAAIGATAITSAGVENGRQSWRIIKNWRK